MNDVVNGGIKSTTVKYTGSGKPFGLDSFISIDVVYEWSDYADEETVFRKQEELLDQLTLQTTDLIQKSASTVKNIIANAPKAQAPSPVQYAPAPLNPVTPMHENPAPPMHGKPAPFGTGAPAVLAVANGATPQEGNWVSVPSRFGDGQIRFISSSVYSSDQLKADVFTWIQGQGINPGYFDVWDERTGPRGAESGNPIGSVFNIKIKKEYAHVVPEEFGRNAAGRGKFNNDGSIYPYWAKDFQSFLKYGGSSSLA